MNSLFASLKLFTILKIPRQPFKRLCTIPYKLSIEHLTFLTEFDMKKHLLPLPFLFLIMMGACEKKQESLPIAPIKEVVAISDTGIAGTKLASVPYGEGQVSFYEFEPGAIGIRHSYSYEKDHNDGSSKRASSFEEELEYGITNDQTLDKIYENLTEKPDAIVIKVLKEAQKRNDVLAKETKHNDQVESEHRPQTISEVNPISKANARTSATCSPDYYNDNYGSQWFLDRYCVEGNFREYYINKVGYERSYTVSSNWSKAHAMAADFEVPISFQGRVEPKKGYPYNKPFFDYDVMPRRIESWYFKDWTRRIFEVNVRSHGPCAKAHLSVLYNHRR